MIKRLNCKGEHGTTSLGMCPVYEIFQTVEIFSRTEPKIISIFLHYMVSFKFMSEVEVNEVF